MIKNLPKKDFNEASLQHVVNEFIKQTFSEKQQKTQKFARKVSILRDKEQSEEEAARNRSHGIGFVEFLKHEDSLKFI